MASNFSLNLYNKIANKYSSAIKVYARYKSVNLAFHAKNKLKSKFYLLKLISAQRRGKNLYFVKPPKGSFNPFSLEKSNKKHEKQECKAIPDSRLLERKSPKELAEELKQFDVISFDVFDTLIFRPFAKPIDIFYLLECKFRCFNFYELRVQAEQMARVKTKKTNFEIDIFDIYEELSNYCFLKKEDAKTEIETEKEVCYANPYMLEVFKLLKKARKKIVVNSDMYLPSNVIKDILDKNGFEGIEHIYVSCEVGICKASGKLFDAMKKDYPNKKIIHIGDSIEADIKGGTKAGLAVYHYKQCNEFGNPMRPANLVSPVSSIYKGVVNNYMYNGTANNTAREDFGFIYAGPIVIGFNEWLNEFSKNNNVDKILFLARDMDIFYKVYNKHQKEFDNDYAVTSRFALQEVIVDDYPAEFFHHTIKARCDRGYSIKQAFNEINLDFLAQYLKEYKLNDSDLIVANKIGRLEKLFTEHHKEISEHFKNNELAAKQYFKEKIGDAKVICAVDLGWRGSILAYLRYLLVDKWKLCDDVKGVLFGSTINTTSVGLISQGIVTSYAYNHIHNRDFLRNDNWEAEYINLLILESIFTSEEASLVEYRLNEKTGKTDFIKYNENVNKDIVKEFQTGIMRFADEFEKFRKPYRQIYPMTAVDAFQACFNIAVNFDYIARVIGDVVDTPFAIAGLNIKEMDYVPLGELMIQRGLIKEWPIK